MAFAFSGGIHPNDKKSSTSGKQIEALKAPHEVILPVSMHIGAPCTPLVKVGDTVDLGQKIADSEAPVSAPVHATISGKVTAVEPRLHPNGTNVLSIVIENDFEDRVAPTVVPKDYTGMSQEEMIALVREAGIVGHGGAAFPTHIKIKSGIGKVDTIIINGAECEPYITSDHRILLERPEEVIGGVKILQKMFGLNNVKIAIERNKENTFAKIGELIAGMEGVSLCPLKTKYPQGADKQLIYALTKREVPSGKLPADAKCAVFNVDTTAAIYRAFHDGMPVIRRIVTVSGSAIANPKNLEVRIGTPVKDLIEAAGGFKEEPNKLLMGGPMMGVAQFSLEIPVFKGTNAFLAFCENEYKTSKIPACIRCGKCVSVCPMRLMPVYMYAYGTHERYDECDKLGVLDCIECGACTYECPARLPLVQSFRTTKQHVLEERKRKG